MNIEEGVLKAENSKPANPAMKVNIMEVYEQHIQSFHRQYRTIKQKRRMVAMFRVFLFVGFIVFFIYHFNTALSYSLYACFPFAIAFIVLVKLSAKLEERGKHLAQLVKINKRELEAVQEKFDAFDGGAEFIDHQHPYADDLDLFGEASLFQILNRTCTLSGKIKLAAWLKNPKTNKEEIELVQQSIQELGPKLSWRQNFEATGMRATESLKEKKELLNWAKGDVYFRHKNWLPIAGIALPLLAAIALVLGIVGMISLLWFFSSFLAQLILVASYLKEINFRHLQVGKKFEIVHKYAKLLEYIEREAFESKYLQAQKASLLKNGKQPGRHVKELAKIIDNLDQRFNVMAAFLLNGLFLWDINYMLKLEKWKETFKEELPDWIDVVSEVDALASIAGFAYNNADLSFPMVEDSSFVIEARDLGHPLLRGAERVTNDFHLTGFSQVVILTGANMAGKSTFLRAIGINLVLAMLGAPVNATRFVFYPIQLHTSLRTNDSLQKHESFFYAELKKLKLIIEKYERGEELFFLLDEILKGTNSRDQHSGSESLIKKLLRLNGVGIIATHDIELANLEVLFPMQVKNHCFEVQTAEDKLIFDYKIKPGYCKVMNASILMKQIGILD